jgi:hypothetical protein
MRSLKEYYGVGTTWSYNGPSQRKAVYNDLKPKERKDLDSMAMKKFGRRFLNIS